MTKQKKIEIKDLRAIQPYKVFATGTTLLFRWIAYKFPNHYWTIYIGGHHVPDRGLVIGENNLLITKAKKLINCDDEVWKRYKKGGETE